MKQTTILVIFIVYLSIQGIAVADNKVAVVPFSGADMHTLGSVITVSKSNGDFTDPVSALNSITNATSDNRYTIVIGPGVYRVQRRLVLKEYVDIIGSGREVTKIEGDLRAEQQEINQFSAVVVGANHASLSHLSIVNLGDLHSIGIYNDNVSPNYTDLSIEARNGAVKGVALHNVGSTLTISHSLIGCSQSRPASNCTGVSNVNSKTSISDTDIVITGDGETHEAVMSLGAASVLDLLSVSILVDGGGSRHGAVNVSGSSMSVSNSNIYINGGGTLATGISVTTSGGPTSMSHTDIHIGAGGDFNFGVFHTISINSSLTITDSRITSPSTAIFASTSTPRSVRTFISNSIISGGLNGDMLCSFSFFSAGGPLPGDCVL